MRRVPPDGAGTRAANRGQLSLSVVEALVGTLLVLSVASGFVLVEADDGSREAQLDAYANDAATVLRGDAPAHNGTDRLAAAARSKASFEREREALADRLREVLPESVLFRVRTPRGTAGYPRPAGVTAGTAVVPTAHGDVTIRVWYA